MRKILVVEDNELNRRVLHNILDREYDVIEAVNGQEALDILHRKHKMISAVLLDIVMPVMNGFEVLDRMRNNAVLSQIPVIVATGAEEDDTEVRALSLGANDFVTKPYNPALILHCLRNTINLRENASIVNAIQRDKLTGLYNRETFFDKTNLMIADKEPGFYVMSCFDIDGFKVVNDQYGALEGDRILQYIGKAVRNCIAEVGGISSRISADNFAALYPAGEDAIRFVTRMRETGFVPPDTHASISFSVGRYIVTDLRLTASSIYDRAFIAKQSVKGRYDVHTAYFNESMREKLLREQAIIGEMDAALVQNHFEAWFQPQFNHATGALIGAEALVRWRHPEKGLIAPDNYIPVFEQNGFIYEMDKYVWEQTCQCLRRWIDEGRDPLPVSVNISRYDAFREDFFESITGLVEKYDIPIDLLRLEITESAFATSTEQIIAIVRNLIHYGFTIEIDDFGSGYSSLNTLKDVPATVLKLDMKFLDTSGDSKRGGNIVESVVRMAKWLGMSVIAEGVETMAQADYLKSIGCNFMQGYLYARPMPAEEYELLAERAQKEGRLPALQTVANLDNNSFWDPASMDTLIFNSYVGGACVFEYHDGSIELLRANDKYAEDIGSDSITVAEALNINWTDHMDDENLEAVRTALEASIQTGGSLTREYVFRDLPGCPEKTYLRTTMRVIAVYGDHYLVYCINENTTAQRQAEQKEHETSEHLRAIMRNINGGVTATVIEGTHPRILFANEQFYAQLGYTREQYEQENVDPHQLIHPDDRARVVQQTFEASEKKQPFTAIYRIVRRDGTIRWLQNNISITAFEDVKDPVQLAVANDITELREIEEKERRASEQVQAIMTDVGSGITAAELSEKDAHFLLANDKYYEIVGYTRAQYEKEVKSIFDLIHPEDRALAELASMEAYRERTSARLEYRFVRRDGEIRWARAILSPTRFTGVDAPVQLGIMTDITDEKHAEQAYLEADDQLRFLNETAHDLLAQPDSERGIELTLFKLLHYFGGHRAYIFEFDYAAQVIHNTYEVCADGRLSEKANLQNVPFSVVEFWLTAFDAENYIDIADVSALDQSRPEKEILTRQGISSLVAVPLRRDGSLIGFVGVDDPGERHGLIERLVALGDYIAVMLTRRDLDAKIKSDNEALFDLMNDMPGGFVRLRVEPDVETLTSIYCNDGFCRLVGMDRAAISALRREGMFAGVHPDDVLIARAALEKAIAGSGTCSAAYRLRRGDGGYVPVTISGKRTQTASGETYLNVYYTDASEQARIEEQRQELLENLPCGAGIYEISGGDIRATYLNKRYRQYLNREIGDLTEAPVIEVVHKDDVKKLQSALRKTLREGTQASCDIRIMDGKGGYIPFRLVGSAMERSGKKAIYVTFTPISQEEQSYSEMLPVVLRAMMASSREISFVKDTNLHYVCASRTFADMAGVAEEKDVVGKTDYDFFDPALADKYTADDRALLASGKSIVDMTETISSPDGASHYVTTSKFLLNDSFGSVIGLYGTSRDITASRDADSKLGLLTDSIPGGLATYLCTSSRITPETVRITYFNDGFCRLFGFEREEYAKISAQNPMTMIFAEDLPVLEEATRLLIEADKPVSCLYRAHMNGGGYKWISHKAVAADRQEETVTINAVLFDVTELQETAERLRISEEEHRLAIEHSGNIICRYSVQERTMTMSPESAAKLSMPERIENVPDAPVRRGWISEDSGDAYMHFFDCITRGDRTGAVTFQQKTPKGWRNLEANFSTIFSTSGEPVSAVISFYDVTEQLEKEAVYKKWQQSLAEKDPSSYTLFRCNLSKNASFDTKEGSLLPIHFGGQSLAFNERTQEYVEKFVFEEDRERYRTLLNSDTLLANYYRGKRSLVLEYREKKEEGGVRWLRLTIDLVEYPNSTDVEAYLMYENIDDTKRQELLTLERAEKDPLTGVLNRTTFALRAGQIMRQLRQEAKCALLMLDIDGFKLVNDAFGHGAGDQALIDIAAAIRQALRRGDMIGRLGGDEFVVFLSDIPNDAVASAKAKQICAMVRKSFSVEVQISASVGIAICPRDGKDFDALYQKADAALYHVKGAGKDHFAFYSEEMRGEHLSLDVHQTEAASTLSQEKKRRMLIVDDSKIDSVMLANIFKDSFLVEKAKDGAAALIRLRHYGSAISVVLLDLVMPGMDGFAVLEKMQQSAELQSIPVIVVSGAEERETSLRAIKCGASDFVTKPVDADLLRLRVQSAISKAENERLRAQNSYLEMESSELAKYRTVLEHTGTVLIEHDWVKGTFSYDPSIPAVLGGVWDGRSLWHILLSDMVADVATVRRMQELVHDVAEDRLRQSGRTTVELRTARKEKHPFRMNVYKRVNEYQLTDKLIITLNEVNAPPPRRDNGDGRKRHFFAGARTKNER